MWLSPLTNGILSWTCSSSPGRLYQSLLACVSGQTNSHPNLSAFSVLFFATRKCPSTFALRFNKLISTTRSVTMLLKPTLSTATLVASVAAGVTPSAYTTVSDTSAYSSIAPAYSTSLAIYSTSHTIPTLTDHSTPAGYTATTEAASTTGTLTGVYPCATDCSAGGSVCVKTSTMIWRSSTSVTTYTSIASSSTQSTEAVATTTGSVIPATGGASFSSSSLDAAGAMAMAMFVGAAALI